MANTESRYRNGGTAWLSAVQNGVSPPGPGGSQSTCSGGFVVLFTHRRLLKWPPTTLVCCLGNASDRWRAIASVHRPFLAKAVSSEAISSVGVKWTLASARLKPPVVSWTAANACCFHRGFAAFLLSGAP